MKKNLFIALLPFLLISCTPHKIFLTYFDGGWSINSSLRDVDYYEYASGDVITISVNGNIDAKYFNTANVDFVIEEINSENKTIPFNNFEVLTEGSSIDENKCTFSINEESFSPLDQSFSFKINTSGEYLFNSLIKANPRKNGYYPMSEGVLFKIKVE